MGYNSNGRREGEEVEVDDDNGDKYDKLGKESGRQRLRGVHEVIRNRRMCYGGGREWEEWNDETLLIGRTHAYRGIQNWPVSNNDSSLSLESVANNDNNMKVRQISSEAHTNMSTTSWERRDDHTNKRTKKTGQNIDRCVNWKRNVKERISTTMWNR